MRRQLFVILIASLASAPLAAQQTDVAATYRATADRIIDRAVSDSAAYRRLSMMVDTFGPRLSGTPSLERAIDWVLAEMKKDGLSNVRGEPVMVPHWIRGEESAELVSPRTKKMAMLGLGGSIATPPNGIMASVLVVSTFDELHAKAAQAKGKIVVFDAPFVSYGQTVAYRRNSASEAAKVGAVAALVRSITDYSQQTPHTGNMHYDTAVAQIPTAAITVEDAEMMHRMEERGEKVVVRLKMSAKTVEDAQSRNVIAEIPGRELPGEVVVLGGHIDSWDVGQGAMDDGGGVVAAWQALNVIKALGLQPRRTIRVVAWTNEENGSKGGEAYAKTQEKYAANHMLMIESDEGTFKPQGFGFTGTDEAYRMVQQVGKLLERIGAGNITRGGGGADIEPTMAFGVPGMGLSVDGTKYFWYHHTEADTIDKLDPHELALCVATMAVMAYVIADMPEKLPHGAAAPGR
jgi:carboxypeptidase Q